MAIDVTFVQLRGRRRAARSDSFSRMNSRFSTALADMLAAAPPEIQSKLRISSGYRSVERQTQLFEAALTKYGSPAAARRWVAPPGHSMHNHGFAADLKYLSPAARQWAHANAERFGLVFPLSNENWHVELGRRARWQCRARSRRRDGADGGADAGGLRQSGAAVSPAAARAEPPGADVRGAPWMRWTRRRPMPPRSALFLLTQHTPPERAKDERTSRYPQTRAVAGGVVSRLRRGLGRRRAVGARAVLFDDVEIGRLEGLRDRRRQAFRPGRDTDGVGDQVLADLDQHMRQAGDAGVAGRGNRRRARPS